MVLSGIPTIMHVAFVVDVVVDGKIRTKNEMAGKEI
jgi:hypothetical protein